MPYFFCFLFYFFVPLQQKLLKRIDMDLEFIERICNTQCPQHDIYRDPGSGMYGECIETDNGLTFTDAPLCESLSVLRNIIGEYDKWLSDFRSVGCDFETAVGLSGHNAAAYWRTRKWAEIKKQE